MADMQFDCIGSESSDSICFMIQCCVTLTDSETPNLKKLYEKNINLYSLCTIFFVCIFPGDTLPPIEPGTNTDS